jgi:hypothetical protein
MAMAMLKAKVENLGGKAWETGTGHTVVVVKGCRYVLDLHGLVAFSERLPVVFGEAYQGKLRAVR